MKLFSIYIVPKCNNKINGEIPYLYGKFPVIFLAQKHFPIKVTFEVLILA